MIIEFIRNENNEIKNRITKMISGKSLSKIVVLGTADDYGCELFNDGKIDDFYISVDKKYTTYKMIESLIDSKNTYIYDNNLHKNTKKENIIFCIYENDIEILISSFEFTKDNLDNSASISIYIRGNKELNEMQEVVNLYNYYKENIGNYFKLDNNVLNKLEENKSLRNSKINTIFEEMQMDEVISSFRNKANAYKNIYDNKIDNSTDEEIDIEINID